MGCRILADKNLAVFYCSTSMSAFGPVMFGEAQAERFMESPSQDPRAYPETELSRRWEEFLTGEDGDEDE